MIPETGAEIRIQSKCDTVISISPTLCRNSGNIFRKMQYFKNSAFETVIL